MQLEYYYVHCLYVIHIYKNLENQLAIKSCYLLSVLFFNPLITVPAVTGRDFAHVRVLFLPPLEGHFLSPIVLIVFRMD